MKRPILIPVAIVVFFFASVVLVDMVEVYAQKRIIYIDDSAWSMLTVPDKETILKNYANTYPVNYWEVRLLYSGKKMGEVYHKVYP